MLLDTVGKPSMSRGASSWFDNVSTNNREVIEDQINLSLKQSFKSKLKFIDEFGCALDIVGRPLVSKIY
jgi:hypothetical protein